MENRFNYVVALCHEHKHGAANVWVFVSFP